MFANRVWQLQHVHDSLHYNVYNKSANVSLDFSNSKEGAKNKSRCDLQSLTEVDHKTCNAMLRDYFQLDVDLEGLYKLWIKADDNFAKVSSSFRGVRQLRQDPVENLFSFICSSNNNIAR